MYLRRTKRKNKDGSSVEYFQLAHNERHPVTRKPVAKIIHNFGRVDQEKSGRHFQTALMDEEDGALSADNAINFIKLYRSFRTMADMDLCLYITHRPEAVAMADSILKFSPGKIISV